MKKISFGILLRIVCHTRARITSGNLGPKVGAGSVLILECKPPMRSLPCYLRTPRCNGQKPGPNGVHFRGVPLYMITYQTLIKESVDSLCRDGAGPPIVCVHWKAVLTCERSCSKPFWTPSYPIPTFLHPVIPPK